MKRKNTFFLCLKKSREQAALTVHSKKCWVKYNPALGKIWTNPAVVFTQWLGYYPEGRVKHLTQLLVENNPACVLSNIYPALGCISPSIFLECNIQLCGICSPYIYIVRTLTLFKSLGPVNFLFFLFSKDALVNSDSKYISDK